MEKKRSTSAKKQTLWNAQSATILSTMEFLTRNFVSSFSSDDLDEELIVVHKGRRGSQSVDAEAIQYLKDRLGINPMQVQLLTCVFYYQAAHPNCMCDIEDLSKML